MSTLLNNVIENVKPAFWCDGGSEVTTEDALNERKYTKAHILESDLFWVFGVELGFVDCSIRSLDDLERAVDRAFATEEEIINEIENCKTYEK